MDIFSWTVSCFLKELQWRLHKDEIIQGKFWLKFLYSNMWQNKQETVTVPNHFSRDDVIFKRIFSIYDADDTLILKKKILTEWIYLKQTLLWFQRIHNSSVQSCVRILGFDHCNNLWKKIPMDDEKSKHNREEEFHSCVH